MTYLAPVAIFLMVLSPLFVPLGVTVVHAVATWRRRRRGLVPVFARWQRRLVALARRRRRLELAVDFR